MIWQVSRFGVHLLVLVALGLTFVLPLVDHHAAERDPAHSHLVWGGTASQRASAIETHRHEYEQPHHHDPLTGLPLDDPGGAPSDSPRVVAFVTQASVDALTIGLVLRLVLVPLLPILAVLALWGRLTPRASQRPWGVTPRVTDPPPRFA